MFFFHSDTLLLQLVWIGFIVHLVPRLLGILAGWLVRGTPYFIEWVPFIVARMVCVTAAVSFSTVVAPFLEAVVTAFWGGPGSHSPPRVLLIIDLFMRSSQ